MLGIHYVCSVFVFKHPSFSSIDELKNDVSTLASAIFMNLQYMAFDDWGHRAKYTLKEV